MDKTLKEIVEKVKENGGKIYQVGGSVRDEILGIQNNDEDYCVTGLEEKEFENIFPNALKLGKDFKVYNINGKEIALARTEKKTKLGHKGFEICTNKNITIEQDLARRDITINSIAKDLITNEYIDPFNGISDIKNKIIRATTNAFKEDPLRVYRVARFAAYLNFEVHENTIEMMKNLKEELLYLPKERIFKEFEKALKSQNPQNFFNVLLKSQVLDVHFKEIAQTLKENYKSVVNSLKKSIEITDDVKVRFAVLVQNMNINAVENLGKRIGLPKKWIKCGKESVLYYNKCKYFKELDLSDKVDLIECVSKSILGIEGLKIISISNNNFNIEYNNIINFEKISNEMLRKINGQYIINKYNIKDGRILKDKLKEERMYWLRENYT